MDSAEDSDTQHALADGSAAESIRILTDNHARFLSFLQKRVESREAAEDILQEAFVRGMRHAASLNDGESATAWFYRLLRNAIVDHYRRRGAETRALERMARLEPGSAEPDDSLMQAICECVVSLIDTLKPEYATAVRRVDLDSLSVPEYAREAGITANNAAVRLHRARLALRRQIEISCGTCTAHGCLDCGCASSPDGCPPTKNQRVEAGEV